MADYDRPFPYGLSRAACLVVRETLDGWVVLARGCRPWDAMPLDDVTGYWRPLLEGLLDPRCSHGSGQEATVYRLAREHGAFRRRQRCPSHALGEELAFVEQALASVIICDPHSSAIVDAVFDALAPALRSVERALHAGFSDCDTPSRRDDW